MGTSSLYGGPKRTSLLPADYNPEDEPFEGNPVDEPGTEETPDNETPEIEMREEQESEETQPMPMEPSVSWRDVRRSMTHAMNYGTDRNVKRAISGYTKALGGHSNATRQAKTAKRTAAGILSYFIGTPQAIRARFEEAGIKFDGRPTKDILNDICLLLAPAPNDFEDSLANQALQEMAADVALDTSIDLSQLDSFNQELLQKLVGGFVKHYIFDKLIMQSEQGALKRCDNLTKLRSLEKKLKTYIDGIVDGVITGIVRSGMDAKDFKRAVETLFDVSYKQMEEL